MPGPLSATVISVPVGVERVATVIFPPFGVYLMALSSRFKSMRESRDSSPEKGSSPLHSTEKAIERFGEAAQFVDGILHRQAVVKRQFADTVGARGHVRDGCEIPPRQKITACRGQNDGDGNEPAQSDPEIAEQLAFGMKRGQDHQPAFGPHSGKAAGVAARPAASAGKRDEGLFAGF